MVVFVQKGGGGAILGFMLIFQGVFGLGMERESEDHFVREMGRVL